MSNIVIHGFGANSGGGGGGGSSVEVDSVTPAHLTIDVVFTTNALLTSDSATASNWLITPSGHDVAMTVTALSRPNATTVRLTTTKAKNGASYVLTIPTGVVNSSDGSALLPPLTQNFTGVATAPSITIISALNGLSVRVLYSETVVEDEAMEPGNYSINNGLTVTEVTKETDLVYILTTSRQTVGQTYTLTTSNIHDLYDNLVA